MIVGKVKYLDYIDGDNAKKSLSFSSVKSNFIDEEIFESALEDCKSIKNKIDMNEVTTPFFNQLSKDIFNSLYKVSPEVYNEKNIYKSLEVENNILKKIISNDKFEDIRYNTAGDIFNSTLALSLFQDKANAIIEEWEKDNKEAMDKINEAILKQEQLNQAMEELENLDENSSKAEGLKDMIEDLKKEVSSANDKISNDVSVSNTLCNKLGKAVESVKGKVSNASKAIDSLGLSNKGGEGGITSSINSSTFNDKAEIVNALRENSTFKKTIEELGKIKESVGKIGKKPSKYGQVICDIGNGNDIRRILSTEKVKLFDNKLENDFYKRYSEKTLLEYKTMGIEDFKGPVVVCLDLSGSMGFGCNEPWSKAVAVASLQIAIKQKRNYRCILFSDHVLDVVDFERGELDASKMIRMITREPSGGTSFDDVLLRALNSIEESNFKKADILFITDGCPYHYLESSFKNRFNMVKKNKGFKVQSILIGETREEFLEEFSDTITLFSDFDQANQNEKLGNIFNNIIDKQQGEI